MVSKLALVDELSSPPLSSSSRARNKTRDVTRGYWGSCLSLRNMVSQLTLMDKLSSPPLSSSSRARNKTRDVTRGYWGSCLSLRNMVSKLALVDELSSPPLGSSSRPRNKARNVTRSHWSSCLSLASLMYCHMVDIAVGEVCTGKALTESDMVDVAEWIVLTGQSRRCGDWSLGAASRGQTVLVYFVVSSEESVVTVGVGGTQGLQVIRQLTRHSTGQHQRDGDQQHHEKLPMTTTPMNRRNSI